MLSKTYDALIEAGASPEKAQAASEEVTHFDFWLIRLEVMSGILIIGMGYMITLLHGIK